MAGSALLSVTLVPVLMMLFIRGRIMPEAKNPMNRLLIWIYRPIIQGHALEVADHRAGHGGAVTPSARGLGSEFMPTLKRRAPVVHADRCRACP